MSPDRLSPQDASFLHIEDDVSHMHIASVSIFEGPPPPFEEVVAMVDAKLDLVPRYRQRVKTVPFELGRPVWVDDPHFNIEYHLRHTALPAPGGERELRKLVGRVMAQQLDRSKPLWEIWVVEGLEDGRWAMLAKTHHAMVDGISGTDLLAVIMDLSPETERPERPDGWEPEPIPSNASLVVEALENMVRSPYEQLRGGASADPHAAADARLRHGGDQWPGRAERARPPHAAVEPERAPGAAPALRLGDDVGRRHQAGAQGARRVVQRCRAGVHHQRVPRPADRPRRGHRTRGAHLGPRIRPPRDDHGKAVGDGTFENKVSAMFAELPVDIEDPVLRLHVITDQMKDLKESKQAVAGEALTSMSGFAPPMLLALGMRLATRAGQRNVNTVTTNVPGPQFPLYAAGRRMVRAFPYVPLGGQIRIGIAIFSYDGEVNFGITGDYDTTEDIDVLTSGIEDGMAQMLKACD